MKTSFGDDEARLAGSSNPVRRTLAAEGVSLSNLTIEHLTSASPTKGLSGGDSLRQNASGNTRASQRRTVRKGTSMSPPLGGSSMDF